MKMESPKVSRMWRDLQKATSRLRDSSILSSCEAEVQELMRQVDLMVDARKQEWANERQSLLAKLNIREQEAVIQKATLSQKNSEISQLRMNVDSMDQSHREIKVKYETELANLREQVSRMKSDYEKLHRRYVRHNQDRHKNPDKNDVKKMSDQLEEWRRKSESWDVERCSLQQQIESLQSQNQMLADKCDAIAVTSSDLRSQLERRREKLSGSEQSLKAQVTQLSTLLEHSKDKISNQDARLSRLQTALDDACVAQRRALQQKEQTETELRDSQQCIRRMEDEAMEMRLNVETQQKMVSSLQDEQSNLNRQITHLQLAVQEKDSHIQTLEHSNPDAQGQQNKLQSALSEAMTELQKCRQNEHQQKLEMLQLRENVSALQQTNDQLKSEIAEKSSVQHTTDSNACNQLKPDSSVCQCREAELISERDRANAAVTAQCVKVTELEKLVDQQTRRLDRFKAEVQVMSAQLRSSQIENRHLRRCGVPVQLQELQDAYTQAADALEQQNCMLKESVAALEDRLLSAQAGDSRRRELERYVASLQAEVAAKDRRLKKLGRANEALTSFANGVDEIVQSPNQSQKYSSCEYLQDDQTDSGVTDQDECMRLLEDTLSLHVDELRAMTDATLKKYIRS